MPLNDDCSINFFSWLWLFFYFFPLYLELCEKYKKRNPDGIDTFFYLNESLWRVSRGIIEVTTFGPIYPLCRSWNRAFINDSFVVECSASFTRKWFHYKHDYNGYVMMDFFLRDERYLHANEPGKLGDGYRSILLRDEQRTNLGLIQLNL